VQADHERRGRSPRRPPEFDAGVARIKARQLAAHRERLRPDFNQRGITLLLGPAVQLGDLSVSCDAGQQTQDDKCEKKFDAVRASLDAFGIGHGFNANNRRGLDLNLKAVTEQFVAKINS
jgi:hypothetical protein